MGACRALLTCWEVAGTFFDLMRAGANGTSWRFAAKGGMVAMSLTVLVLSTQAVCDVVLDLAFSFADDQILATNISFLDISRKSYDDGEVCLVFASISRS